SSCNIPDYLRETYSWAYLKPGSIWCFERAWVVNLILWGNMNRLTRAVIEEIDPGSGPVLQVACVYGNFSRSLADHLLPAATSLDIVDIAPIQLQNAQRKLADCSNVFLHQQDSSRLRFTNAAYATTVLFFLLHEQPAEVRRKTIAEAIRVTRPGGKVIIVDYHRPSRFNPLYYVMKPVLHWLEPFALDLWRSGLERWLDDPHEFAEAGCRNYFGGLYQRRIINC
ncbi:MAG TPA: rhodoquinone biosynthesis methyltransferase RquA, partial [Xanthomonadales bacterium]|nr:rhodoquinone biosynthesis methyltransferase RquA [Xanthomonadales bacterium]